jgi:(p)ppGpp synthase/HD superfamily hydrolase
MTDTEHRKRAPQRTATNSGEADMKPIQDHAAAVDQRHLDKAGRLKFEHPERLVCHLVSATAREATVARPHDVVKGVGVAREHLEDGLGPQVAAPVDAITDIGRHRTPQCSPTGGRQPNAILLRVALEVSACVRS